MKAKVKDIAVRHNGKRYEKDEELVIDKNSFNDKLFVCLDDSQDDSEEKVEDTKAKK
ncbi:conjugal transfer protein [Liquorilactobacillus hordei]|uniref:conjugal transfer protein n=1 Tax=Liquorilactobacillus hordei TaxID=468911 RepID=UPI0039EBFF4D